MKKFLSVFLTVLLFSVLLAPTAVFPVGAVTDGIFSFFAENGTATLTKVDPSATGHITVPDRFLSYPVDAVKEGAFEDCGGITEITFGQYVRIVQEGAFSGCTSLKKVCFNAEELSSLGKTRSAFAECPSLEAVVIGGTVTGLPQRAFSQCSALKSVTLPESLEKIGDEAFKDCAALAEIALPQSVREIGKEAFAGCKALSKVEFPAVKTIKDSAFSGCVSLPAVTLPDELETIGNSVFSGCSALKTATLPDSVVSVGNSVFSGCSSLESLTSPFIGKAAASRITSHIGYFFGAEKAEQNVMFVPESLKRVTLTKSGAKENAFLGCEGIEVSNIKPNENVSSRAPTENSSKSEAPSSSAAPTPSEEPSSSVKPIVSTEDEKRDEKTDSPKISNTRIYIAAAILLVTAVGVILLLTTGKKAPEKGAEK